MSTEVYEMKLEDFEAICTAWQMHPEQRESIEHSFAEIGIIAKGVPLGDDVYLDVTIPDNIYIEAPPNDDDESEEA